MGYDNDGPDEGEERTATQVQVDSLLEEARKLEYGPERIAKCEEAVRIADAGGATEEPTAFSARLKLVEAATFGGYPEKAFVAFGWCAQKSAAEPDRFRESYLIPGFGLLATDFLWAFKWVTLQVPWYPQLSRAQIDETLDDMEARWRRHDLSLRPVYMQRTRLAQAMGDPPDDAMGWYRKWQWAPRDGYADCKACEVNFQMHFHAHREEHERAFEVAQPLLSGALSCSEVPHVTYGTLLASALALGRADEAREMHTKGYELIQSNRDFVATVAEHIDYLVAAGALEDARQLVERHLPWALDNRVAQRRMEFQKSARDLCAAWESTTMALRLPESHPLFRAEGSYEREVLRAHFAEEVATVAKRFDERNGNDYVSRRMGVR